MTERENDVVGWKEGRIEEEEEEAQTVASQNKAYMTHFQSGEETPVKHFWKEKVKRNIMIVHFYSKSFVSYSSRSDSGGSRARLVIVSHYPLRSSSELIENCFFVFFGLA